MILGTKSKREVNTYCEHTEPRRFHTLHLVAQNEDVMEFLGRKVANRYVILALSFIVKTICLFFSIINPVVKLFGCNLIESEKKEIRNDRRCESCKKLTL